MSTSENRNAAAAEKVCGSDVYEVCARLKALGFPQKGYKCAFATVNHRWVSAACPNVSECMKYAVTCSLGLKVAVSPSDGGTHYAAAQRYVKTGEHTWNFIGGAIEGWSSDPDQAARLALAAALARLDAEKEQA